MEVDKDGKTVRINSPATVQMIEWYKKMFRDCMEPEVLSWSDASNNESIQQGKAGWIHNPVSAYIVAKQRKLVTADGINHHRSLGGPQGRHETDTPRHIGIWKFSKNIEASKEWIRYLLGKREVYDEYIMSGDAFNLPVYEKLQDHPVLRTDPKYAALRGEGVQYHTYGWPAPPSDKVQLITNSYLLPNMIAKAVTGTSTKDAIAWAENEMKKILAGSVARDHGGQSRRDSGSARPPARGRAAERVARPRGDPGAGVRDAGPAPPAPARRLSVRDGAVLRAVQRLHRPAEPLHRASATSSSCGTATPSARPSRTPSCSPGSRWPSRSCWASAWRCSSTSSSGSSA